MWTCKARGDVLWHDGSYSEPNCEEPFEPNCEEPPGQSISIWTEPPGFIFKIWQGGMAMHHGGRREIYIYIYCFSFLQVRWTRKYKTRDGWSTISIGCVSIPITRKIEILNNIPDFHRGISVSTRVPLGKVASGKIPETLLDILPVHQREVNFRRPLQLDTFHGISQRLLACCCAWIQWASFFWEKNLRTLKGCQLLVKLLAFSQEAWKKDALFAQMQVPLAQPQRDNAAGGWNCPVCNNYNYAIRTTKRD